MATVIFQAAPSGFEAEADEEIRMRRRAQLYIGDALNSTGELIISTRCLSIVIREKSFRECTSFMTPLHLSLCCFSPLCLVLCRSVTWQPEGTGAHGFSLSYQSIVMHAVSRDTSCFHSACLYLQIDV